MQQFIIEQNQAGQRLDKFLHKYLPNAGTGFLYKMLRKKNITLNGKKAEGNELLKLHDEIRCFFSEETFAKFSGNTAGNTEIANHPDLAAEEYLKAYSKLGENSQIHVLYEDSDVLILNKPAGILTQKAQPGDFSLNEWMIGYLLSSGKITVTDLALFKPSVCNRLDRNTSGLVLCGISLTGSQLLSEMIRNRSIRKFYRTICKGSISQKAVLEGSLSKDKKSNMVTVSIEGSEIKTAYEPIRQLKHALTYLEVELITGKTHQIRAHLAAIGNPLAGDAKYGNKALNQQFRKKYQLNYQLLHAYRIEFPALSGKLEGLSKQVITAPLPRQFRDILEDLS